VKRLAVSAALLSAFCLVGAAPAPGTAPGPNGKIAFVKAQDVWSVNPDGTGLTQLTNTQDVDEDDPASSPDGNYIAYTRLGGNELWVMRADGAEEKWVANITDGSNLAWSPDGSKIAFLRMFSFQNGIYVINRDGTGLHQLRADDGVRTGPSWSPDGTRIAFSRPVGINEEIWTMNADGTSATSLTVTTGTPGFSGWPNWSPDGSTIVFASSRDCNCLDRDIYTVPSGGGPVTRLTAVPTVKADPVWSPDGARIGFTSCVYEPNLEDCFQNLVVMNADGSGQTVVQGTPAAESAPDWQPAVGPALPPIQDALDKIAFQSSRDHPGSSASDDIFTMNPDGSGQRALSGSSAMEGQAAWSPDGTKIAFASRRTNNDEIWVMNADGTGLANLTNTGLGSTGPGEGSPTWSPDGTRVAYARNDNDRIGLWIMNANGSGQTQITTGPRDDYPDWSPDGTKLAFAHGNSIYTINVDGSGLTPLTAAEPDFDQAPDWSPDGSKIAFMHFAPSGNFNVSNVWVMNSDGTGQHQVTNMPHPGAGFPAWSPDGRRIAFNGPSDNPFHGIDVFVMNADGTGQVDITNSLGADTRPDWRPVLGYPRPRGATPMRVSLVPAAAPCSAPNTTHGAPLSFGSCTRVQHLSQHLTTGTPDANGRAVRMSSFLELRALTGDARVVANVNDVANGDLTDYTGELRINLPMRITDRNSPSAASVSPAASTLPFALGIDVPCAADAGPAGSTCAIDTTVDAIVAGAVADGLRTVWQMGQVRVFDGGADGEGSTTGDNTLFLTQGIFIP
jgi:Tol biopolymer transport system component